MYSQEIFSCQTLKNFAIQVFIKMGCAMADAQLAAEALQMKCSRYALLKSTANREKTSI